MSNPNTESAPGRLVLAFVVLLAAVGLFRPLEECAAGLAKPVELQREQMRSLVGPGGILAVLGGLRSVAASGFWLQASAAWESRDAAGTIALIELTVAADEQPLYFWLNGARMIACDLPEWQLADAPAAVRRKVTEEYAGQALRFLEKGVRWHGPDAALFVEMANIHLRRRGDLEEAARCYRLAARLPGAPYYAARIHGELLRALGRPEEALRWLRQVLPNLPARDPAARRDAVLERIGELERVVQEAGPPYTTPP